MIEIVKTKAGIHVRIIARNGKILMSSEVYKTRQGANKLKDILKKGEVLKDPKTKKK